MHLYWWCDEYIQLMLRFEVRLHYARYFIPCFVQISFWHFQNFFLVFFCISDWVRCLLKYKEQKWHCGNYNGASVLIIVLLLPFSWLRSFGTRVWKCFFMCMDFSVLTLSKCIHSTRTSYRSLASNKIASFDIRRS